MKELLIVLLLFQGQAVIPATTAADNSAVKVNPTAVDLSVASAPLNDSSTSTSSTSAGPPSASSSTQPLANQSSTVLPSQSPANSKSQALATVSPTASWPFPSTVLSTSQLLATSSFNPRTPISPSTSYQSSLVYPHISDTNIEPSSIISSETEDIMTTFSMEASIATSLVTSTTISSSSFSEFTVEPTTTTSFHSVGTVIPTTMKATTTIKPSGSNSPYPTNSPSPAPSCNCAKDIGLYVGIFVPCSALISSIITALICYYCQRAKKKNSYIRMAPTVYFDEEEQD